MPLGFVTKGTKENFIVTIVDREGLVTDLSGSTPTFLVEQADGTDKQSGSATAVGMKINVLVDTTTGGVWAAGDYKLTVTFTVGSQIIKKGPFPFTIVE